jgi:hypothetical protein
VPDLAGSEFNGTPISDCPHRQVQRGAIDPDPSHRLSAVAAIPFWGRPSEKPRQGGQVQLTAAGELHGVQGTAILLVHLASPGLTARPLPGILGGGTVGIGRQAWGLV